MSHVDAENALKIYQHFCKQTERVVNYLGVAKKLQNVLNVQIPNLRHVSIELDGEPFGLTRVCRLPCRWLKLSKSI